MPRTIPRHKGAVHYIRRGASLYVRPLAEGQPFDREGWLRLIDATPARVDVDASAVLETRAQVEQAPAPRSGQETLHLAEQAPMPRSGEAPRWPCRHLRALPGGVLVSLTGSRARTGSRGRPPWDLRERVNGGAPP